MTDSRTGKSREENLLVEDEDGNVQRMNTEEKRTTKDKRVVYTAIPKFLVYYNLRIGAYVENQGYTANTPWQYTYAMGDKVDYGELKDSLKRLVEVSHELWVFAEKEGTFPRHEDAVIHGLGVTDGIVDEIKICKEDEIPVTFFHIDAESGEISKETNFSSNFNLGVMINSIEEQ